MVLEDVWMDREIEGELANRGSAVMLAIKPACVCVLCMYYYYYYY